LLREFWLKKYVKTCRKLEETEHIEWLFKIDVKSAVECLQSKQLDLSQQIFAYLKKQGGIKACIYYLEFVCV
jgi:hypothetical protein